MRGNAKIRMLGAKLLILFAGSAIRGHPLATIINYTRDIRLGDSYMNDEDKTREDLILEMEALRKSDLDIKNGHVKEVSSVEDLLNEL